jgi:N-methylhydantoinase B
MRTMAESNALLALLTTADPTIPVNYGLCEAVEFVFPEASVINPRYPATMNTYIPASHIVYNCVLTALGKFNPTRAVAPSGLGSGAVSIGFQRKADGRSAVLYELLSIGLGGTPRNDGTPMVHAVNHFTPGAPVEIVESEYPLRVRRFDMRIDSAGAGRHRGGVGYIRQLELLEDCTLTVRTSNHCFGAWGVNGGLGPKAGRIVINPNTQPEEMGPLETRRLKAGDIVSFERSGGGGYGAPNDRPAEAVMDDVRNGYITLNAAADVYGQPLELKTVERT